MRRTNWVVVGACLSVLVASVAEAKKPWRFAPKHGKSAKSYRAVDAPLPLGAPMPVYDDGQDISPELLPEVPGEADPPSAARARWNELLERSAQRRAQFQQDRSERRRSLAARLGRPTANDARVPSVAVPPAAVAHTPVPTDSSRRRSWFGRTTPQPAEASRPIANRFDIRRQAEQPIPALEAPRFDPSADASVITTPPAILPPFGEELTPPEPREQSQRSGQVRQWWSQRFGSVNP